MARKAYLAQRPGSGRNRQKWRSRWFTSSIEDRAQLREQYGHDFRRYCAAYIPNDEDFTYFQDIGMECFVKTEKKLLEQARLQPYRIKGQELLRSFTAALCCGETPSTTNLVFVSMDFEGELYHKGIDECGIAELDVDAVLSHYDHATIKASDFGLKPCCDRKFVFG